MASRSDVARLRELAERFASVTESPRMDTRRDEWYSHNALNPGRPLFLVHPEGSWEELLPESVLTCEGEIEREIEYKLLAQLYQHDNLGDDMVFEPVFLVPKGIDYTGFLPGGETRRTTSFYFHTGLTEPVVGWELNPISGFIPALWESDRAVHADKGDQYKKLVDDDGDLSRWTHARIEYLERESVERYEKTRELIGDLLEVKLVGVIHYSVHLASTYCSLRGGLMNMLYDLVERPDLVHRIMNRLSEINLELIGQYEAQGLLEVNNRGYLQSTGGLAFTNELPSAQYDPEHVRAHDIWASCESQEFSTVSPAMHAEFVISYEKEIMKRFGLTGYGCCEPLENVLENLVDVPNLRRISCSPFADVAAFAKGVKDRFILSWKPNPSILSHDFEESELSPYIKKAVADSRGSILEIILKDTHTCQGDPARFKRWMRVAREATESVVSTW